MLSADARLGAWSRLLSDTWQRSWRLLALIFVVTFTAPYIAAAVVSDSAGGQSRVGGRWPLPAPDGVGVFSGLSPASVAVEVVIAVAVTFAGAIGWGAGIWAVTQLAAGLPATLGEALRAGARRVWPMFGWYLLYLLLVMVGIVLCVLPGLYMAFAGAVFSFVVIYEPGRPAIVRSFALVHKAFVTALGRVGLLLLGSVVAGATAAGVNLGLGFTPGRDDPGNPVGAAVIDGLVVVPMNIFLLVGLLLTYTQLRMREGQLTTAELWRVANPR